ncbi:MAG: hypothetical protein NTX53_16150 [candidate division WOR-3 bacterium]|nr:hypothetical protein [candidate division WOR-3 bacterium]
MKIRFLSIAGQELDDAFAWYERQSAGLGYEADAIVIVAVAHLHREPRYWIGRLDDA